ncbi:endonuclease NucS domain-containing protein [Candidatus Thioglobus sp.]|uniref:endonuclease NucS domain-containing protein n=1 Tax=Candidatus Thioglobus sp. TaxID=2026721 RepID=UPI003D113D10
MEQLFKNWLTQIRHLQIATANSYSRAIHKISEHYSQNTETQIDIYAVTEQNLISQIAHDYSQAGRFSEFGYEHHSLYRAAISRYSEFFVHHNDGTDLEDNELLEEENNQNQEPERQTNFAYERDLQTALCAQISELFPGYKIFGESNNGIEYAIGGRRIDVLLEHIESGDLLVVELKSGIADFRVFGQISMYLGLVKNKFPNKSITGVVIAATIHDSLRQACEITDRVELKTYRMSVELENA